MYLKKYRYYSNTRPFFNHSCHEHLFIRGQIYFLWLSSKKEKELEITLKKLSKIDFSLVFFVPSIKINFYIKFFKKYFEDRDILIAREITKMHETFYRSAIRNLKLFTTNLKGELTVVLSKKILKMN